MDGPKSGAEISKELGLAKGGRVAGALARLTESGFLAPADGVNPETGERPREKRYRLRDNYTRFYLKVALVYDGKLSPSWPPTDISTR